MGRRGAVYCGIERVVEEREITNELQRDYPMNYKGKYPMDYKGGYPINSKRNNQWTAKG